MKKKSWIAVLLVFVMLMSACGAADGKDSTETGQTEEEAGKVSGNTELNYELFSDRDFQTEYDESKSAKIVLNGSLAQCSSDAVTINGSTVTIQDEGTYILSGTLDDGMIIVNGDKEDKVQIVLDHVEIHSETCAPIYILQADKVFVTMKEGSNNALSNGGVFTSIDENNIDAVIFSKEDLTLNGEGILTVSSPAGHGIVSKDELKITSGEYIINSASSGISGKDNVCIADGEFEIKAGKDGIKAENDEDETAGFVYIHSGSFDISAEGDGISAGEELLIEDGTFDIVTGGGSSNGTVKTSENWGNFMGGHGMGNGRETMTGNKSGEPVDNKIQENIDDTSAQGSEEDSTSIKGIKAGADLTIQNGIISINSADDAVHSNSNVTIGGGSFSISTGDDGFHADDTLTVAAGIIDITECYEGLEGLHVLVSGGSVALTASDDGMNAAGGTDSSGTEGVRGGDAFRGHGAGGPGAMSSSSDGSIVISGGNIHINASGDGLDANGTLEISGGTTVVSGPFNGDTATLDYDISGIITGGTFIGTGASGMAQTFSGSEQGVIAVNAGNQAEGTRITLKDSDGKIVIEHEAELSFAVVIISSPDLVSGETYEITVGEISGEFTAS